jgi:hypothetical protein
MKKMTSIFVAVFFALFLITSCGNDSTTNETNNNEVTNEITDEVDDSDYYEEDVFTDEGMLDEMPTLVDELIFIEGSSFEGEADLVFETIDGEYISFYMDFFDENQPELDYFFIGEDGMSANPELVGETFYIEYEFVENGRITVEGDEEDCFIIYDAELM